MIDRWVARAAILLLLTAASVGEAHAVPIGLVEDFSAGTGDWTNAQAFGFPPFSPVQDPGDVEPGPDGLGDAYLRLQADALLFAGRKLVTSNRDNPLLLGNYSAAGVSAVSLTLKSFSDEPLFVRLQLSTLNPPLAPGQPQTFAGRTVTLDVAELLVGSDWQTFSFSLDPGRLILGPEGLDPAAILADVDELRIMHNPNAWVSGMGLDPLRLPDESPPITGQLGVDNIAFVPEPSTALLVAGGLLGLAVRGRRGL